MEEIVSRRIGKIIDLGASLGLTLREEFLDLELEGGKEVQISVINIDGRKKIIIEKIEKG